MALFGGQRRIPCVSYPLKRLVDVVGSSIALVLLAPAFVLIAIAVKLDSKGPILFRQQRLGLGEHPFTILKFRSMRVDAARLGPAFTEGDDPRITRVGRVLRKTSLDELPQMLNVLRGEMSLIGPRPFAGFELQIASDEQRASRASVRPGISGLAQTSGRSSLTPEQTLELDLEYAAQCGLIFDFALLCRTVIAASRLRQIN